MNGAPVDPFAEPAAPEPPQRVPTPRVVVGPPLEEYFTRAQLDKAKVEGISQGKAIAKAAFDRMSLISIAWERFDRWLRRL